MSKDDKTFDLEDRLIDFALRIIRRAEALILQDERVRKQIELKECKKHYREILLENRYNLPPFDNFSTADYDKQDCLNILQ